MFDVVRAAPSAADRVRAGHDVVADCVNAPPGINHTVEPHPIANLWYEELECAL